MNLSLSSKAPKECREALENLLFFNPRQHLVREGILQSLEEFGHPQIVELADGLSVQIKDYEIQTLFAFDRERRDGNLVGVVLFLRTSPAEVAVLHVAVHPDYALQGEHVGAGLGVILVEKVKEICSRIVGVERIVFFYRRQVVIRVNT
ncbi:MAG TPA: hypothetical protein VG077_06730 [Verrucomicrobiae bacterium]|nr:hypothetical protein [Verrucomicrobiae bacterium]